MIKIHLLTIAVICSVNIASAQQSDEATLIKLNHDWIASYVTRDTATMNRILAPDMQLVSPSGRIFSKSEMLKGLLSTGAEYLTSNVDTVWTRLFGTVGLVNSRATVKVKSGGQISTVTTSYLDIYEKRNGQWVAVAAHVKLVN